MDAIRLQTAVLTAPRKGGQLYIAESLDSYFAAGWMPRPHIFAEPNSPLWPTAGERHILVSRQQLGLRANFCWAAEWMLNNRQFSHLMICEDDIEWLDGSATTSMEGVEAHPNQIISPYTAEANSTPGGSGWLPANLERQYLCGNLARIFPRNQVGRLVRFIRNTKPAGTELDYWVGEFVKQADCQLLCHHPSLVKHLGEYSTEGGKRVGFMRKGLHDADS